MRTVDAAVSDGGADEVRDEHSQPDCQGRQNLSHQNLGQQMLSRIVIGAKCTGFKLSHTRENAGRHQRVQPTKVSHVNCLTQTKVCQRFAPEMQVRTGRWGASTARSESVAERATNTSPNVRTVSMHQALAGVLGGKSWLAAPPAAAYGIGLYCTHDKFTQCLQEGHCCQIYWLSMLFFA